MMVKEKRYVVKVELCNFSFNAHLTSVGLFLYKDYKEDFDEDEK
jgi:hypothetical protein